MMEKKELSQVKSEDNMRWLHYLEITKQILNNVRFNITTQKTFIFILKYTRYQTLHSY